MSFHCPTCGSDFTTVKDVRKRASDKSMQRRHYRCKSCNATFTTFEMLGEHMTILPKIYELLERLPKVAEPRPGQRPPYNNGLGPRQTLAHGRYIIPANKRDDYKFLKRKGLTTEEAAAALKLELRHE